MDQVEKKTKKNLFRCIQTNLQYENPASVVLINKSVEEHMGVAFVLERGELIVYAYNEKANSLSTFKPHIY